MEKILGRDFKLYTTSADCFAAAKTCSLQFDQSLIETIPEESWADKSFIPDKSEWKITVAGLLVNINDTFEGSHVYDFINDRRTAHTFHFTEKREGKQVTTYAGKVYLYSANIDGQKDKISTYSCTFKGTGPLVPNAAVSTILARKHPLAPGGGGTVEPTPLS